MTLNRIRRFCAKVYISIFHYKLIAVNGWRSLFFYRMLYPNFTIGVNPKIWGEFFIHMYSPLRSTIRIGDNLHMISDHKRSALTSFNQCKFTVYPDASIHIGDNVAMTGVTITSKKRITIGSHTMISPNVIIMDSDFHVLWPPDKRFEQAPPEFNKEINIGKNVWIGLNSIVLKGVTIGDNSIIGAGSLVTSDIPKNVVAAGNPARVIKKLNSTPEASV